MRYSVKEFFTSDPYESGSMVLTISTNRMKDYDGHDFKHKDADVHKSVRIDGRMKLSDCDQSIHLDFVAVGDRAVEGRIAKFDKIIDELTKMKENYISMYEKAKEDWQSAKMQWEIDGKPVEQGITFKLDEEA